MLHVWPPVSNFRPSDEIPVSRIVYRWEPEFLAGAALRGEEGYSVNKIYWLQMNGGVEGVGDVGVRVFVMVERTGEQKNKKCMAYCMAVVLLQIVALAVAVFSRLPVFLQKKSKEAKRERHEYNA